LDKKHPWPGKQCRQAVKQTIVIGNIGIVIYGRQLFVSYGNKLIDGTFANCPKKQAVCRMRFQVSASLNFSFFEWIGLPMFSITRAAAPINSAFLPTVETFTSVCSDNLGIQYLFKAC